MVDNKKSKLFNSKLFIHIFFILFSLAFILPFIMLISVSLSNEFVMMNSGYSLFPKQLDLSAYKIVFKNPTVTVTEMPLVTSIPLPNDRPALQGYGVGSSTPAMTTQTTIVTTTQTCPADPNQTKVNTTEKNSSTTPNTVY